MRWSPDNLRGTRSERVPRGALLVCALLQLLAVTVNATGADVASGVSVELGVDGAPVSIGREPSVEVRAFGQARAGLGLHLSLGLGPGLGGAAADHARASPDLRAASPILRLTGGIGLHVLFPRAVALPDPALLPGRALVRASAGLHLARPDRASNGLQLEGLLDAALQPASGTLLLWPGLRTTLLLVGPGVRPGEDVQSAPRAGISAYLLWEAPGVLRPGMTGVLRW